MTHDIGALTICRHDTGALTIGRHAITPLYSQAVVEEGAVLVFHLSQSEGERGTKHSVEILLFSFS